MQKGKTCWKAIADAAEKTLTLRYLSQEDEIVEEVVHSLDDFSDDMIRLLALHGWKQRTQDSCAGFSTIVNEHGYDAALTWAQDNQAHVYETQLAGEWSARGEGTLVRVTILMQAIAKVYGQEIDVVVAKIFPLSKEDKAALAKKPAIAVAMYEVKAERAAAKAKVAQAIDINDDDLPSLFD